MRQSAISPSFLGSAWFDYLNRLLQWITFFHIRVQYFPNQPEFPLYYEWLGLNSVLCHASTAESNLNSEQLEVLVSWYQTRRTWLYGATCQWFKKIWTTWQVLICVHTCTMLVTAAYQNRRRHPKFGNRSADSWLGFWKHWRFYFRSNTDMFSFFSFFWLREQCFVTDLLFIVSVGMLIVVSDIPCLSLAP